MQDKTGSQDNKRVWMALAVWVVWVLVTLFGMRWAGDGSKKSLLEGVNHGVSWNLVMALAVLALATFALRWRDLKFVAPKPTGSLRVLWFPVLYLLFFGVLASVLGIPPLATLGFVFLNTVLVGLSEEWAFRGVLFQGLHSRVALWPAILITTGLFGGVHVLNVFTTGLLLDSVVQAVAAAMSGVVLIALLIRTGSIWVPIIYHALWDFGTFVISSGASGSPPADLSKGMMWAVPMLLVLPNFLYAVYLLRKVRNDTVLSTD